MAPHLGDLGSVDADLHYCLPIEHAEKSIMLILNSTAVPYRDNGQSYLETSLARPLMSYGGKSMYKDPLSRAAALMQSINSNHPLIDGNKRASWVLANTYLERSGFEIVEDAEVAAEFVISTIADNWDVQDMALWFADRF